jgi:hypothetical protein
MLFIAPYSRLGPVRMARGTIDCMFAMLRGPWPRTTSEGIDLGELEATAAAGGAPVAELGRVIASLRSEVVTAQVQAGMDLVTDGHVGWADPVGATLAAFAVGDTGPGGMLVRAWTATAALTGATVAQAVPGPCTLARREVGEWGDLRVLNGQALAHAGVLAGELAALRDAGCAVVIVEEPAAVGLGRTPRAADGWVRAHRRLLRDAGDLHVMLAITGGAASDLGGRAVFGVPYGSLLVDLVGGPDNWHLVREAPGQRGIVCAALVAAPGTPLGDQSPQLVWAAQYAASMDGRGLERVGLANASSLGNLSTAEARAALQALAQAARYAVMSRTEAVAAGFDEKAWRVMPGAPGRPQARAGAGAGS